MESPPVLILLALIVMFLAWAVIGFTGKMISTAKNKRIAEDKVLGLQTQKDKLSVDLARLETDRGVEESIREKFGLAKEGEGLIVVVEDKKEAEVEPPTATESFLSFFKKMFSDQ